MGEKEKETEEDIYIYIYIYREREEAGSKQLPLCDFSEEKKLENDFQMPLGEN